MDKTQYFIRALFIASLQLLFGQADTLRLDDVVLSDVKLKRYENTTTLKVLNDSILQTQSGNTTEFLRFNTPIYFKENGFGMVSSPAFRGTSAAQTAVVWNGININSKLNGQTDFNSLSLDGYDHVTIKSGGGSVAYGTGAIGGSVHLSNTLQFDKHLDNEVAISIGSFNTQRYRYQLKTGSHKWAINSSVQFQRSDNNYKYLETNEHNKNGAFDNLNIGLNLGWFISQKHIIKLYHQSFNANRELSGTLVAPSQSTYKDETHRSLFKWTYLHSKFVATFNTAYVTEKYKYFPDKAFDSYSFGSAKTFLIRYNVDYRFSEKTRANAIIEYNTIKGGGSNIQSPNNSTFSSTALIQHQFGKDLKVGVKLRKEWNSEFDTPMVFGFTSGIDVSKTYKITLQVSKDFRVPTFNDLYWQPGGNLDLVPEVSHQLDLGQQFTFKRLIAKAHIFIIDIEDMIQWTPNTSGVWSPINKNKVQSTGLELGIEYTFKNLLLNGNYNYTDSRDKTTEAQLTYVPFHKFTGAIAYSIKNISAYYQQLFNGEVYANGRILDAYIIANVGVNYTLKTKTFGRYTAGVKVNNVFNTYYENVAVRPMPNRNFNFNLTYNF